MNFISDSSDYSDSNDDIFKENIIYTPEVLNDILLSKNKLICNEFDKVTLIGDIKECKIWKKSGMSFKITNNNISFDCKLWTSRSKLSTDEIIKNENKLCKIEGYLNCDYYYGHKYILNVSNLILENENSRLKLLKDEIIKFNLHNNKKIIEWNKINRIGIISKKETQGYNDFVKQFNLNIPINLIEITLEGENTANETMIAIDNLQSSDIIIIIRGGGATNEISNSFDNIELFKKIKNSYKPIISAIGHEYDKGDKLLITEITDLNYSTPTTAALQIKSELISHRVKKINNLYQMFITKLYKTLDDKENELFNVFDMIVDSYYKKFFGGPIINIDENDKYIIVCYNNEYYKIDIRKKEKTDINKEIIENYNKLKYSIEIKNLDDINKILTNIEDDLINKHFKKIKKNKDYKIRFNNLIEKYDETMFDNLNITKINKIDKLFDVCEHLNYCKSNISTNKIIFDYFNK